MSFPRGADRSRTELNAIRWNTPSAFNQDPLFIPSGQQDLVRGQTHPLPDRIQAKDLEEANHRINQLLWRLNNAESVPSHRMNELIDDLHDIENLIYRNLK